MSQVLEKPILLDETGQEIVDKLDDIRDAIGTSSEFIPLLIKVLAPPTKTTYIAGDTLDLTGMVVVLVASNGTQIDITSACTFNPANGAVLTSANTSVEISYYYAETAYTFTTSQAIAITSLSSIEITTPPTQTEYVAGDELDLTGMVVTAHFDNGTSIDATSLCTYTPADGDTLTSANTTITASLTMGENTRTATQAIDVYSIYGVEWDGTATSAWTRTDAAAGFTDPNPYYANMTDTPSSPFDNIYPWSGMEVVSDESIDWGTYGNQLVKIPKFYYKLTQNGAGLKIQITQAHAEGFHVSPAHMDRGDGEGERDFVYVGRFHFPSGSSNALAYSNATIAQARTYSHRTSEVWLWDFATRFTIWLLYLVEFADWNSQEKIGYGCTTSTTQQSNPIDAVNIPYHTGTSQATRTTYGGGMQYRWIAELWSTVYDWLDGCRYGSSETAGVGLYVAMKPSEFSESSGGVLVGNVPNGICPSAFEVKDVTGAFPLFIPVTSGTGSNSEYSCDAWYSQQNGAIKSGGAYERKDLRYGLFYISGAGTSTTDTKVGFRLMKLPANS